MNLFRKSEISFFFIAFFIATRPAWADLDSGIRLYEAAQYTDAFKVLKPLADTSSSRAQYLVGAMYANGNGISKNEEEAASWYLKAARQGDSDAQLAIADMYASGKGTIKDDALAAYWQWRAAYTFMDNAKKNMLEEYIKQNPSLATHQVSSTKNDSQREIAKLQHCDNPRYPEDARASNQQGKVILTFLLDKDGSVLDLAIAKSSGWPILDQASLKSFRTCTFVPTKMDGQPVQSIFSMSYTWHLRGLD